MELIVKIKNRVATYQEQGDVLPICGNTDDVVRFEFDDEWDDHDKKTARFIWGGKHNDVEFTGDTCEVPVVTNTQVLLVGVYAGELPADGFMLSTTNASIKYQLSTRCVGTTPNPSAGQNYTNEAKGYAEEAKAAAAEAAKYGFKVVGTFEDKCIYRLETSPQMFMDRTYKWYDEYEKSAGGRWFMVGASDPRGINFQNPQGYEDLLNLTKASTFITLHIKDSGASFANGDTEYKEVLGGLTSTFIFGDFRPSNENEVIDAVKERMPYVTNTRFVEVITDEANYLLVYLSDFVTSSMAYMYADGTAGGLLFTGYSDRVEEE